MIRFLLWCIILGILGYCAYLGVRFVKIRVNYSSLKDEAIRLLDPTSPYSFESIPERLLEKAKELNIPFKEENIHIFIDDWEGYKVLSFEYTDSLPILKFKTLYFKFSFVDTVFTNR
ncbi:MAG: hypothetical protein ABIN61_02985 [candidate division WOR-3 bacterium]